MKNIIRSIAILAYLSIILMGEMIGLPFFFWLIFTSLHFGNIDQLFAILGLIGIGLNLSKWKNSIPITLISFLFMLAPILSRIAQVPIEKFDYPAFKIPLWIFIITYIVFILLNIFNRKTESKTPV
ncbi:hypothetical protein NAT51_15255 [Flavobacterium amniphilum]|uniref:hypothetical protein n=1 Tax=Flavobacterium amniphilum TaxID=1834035 RepID=UPI00202A9E90|nr:hypothetical protein [Flavobacterium amniphilum]MCL9806892.1 hypothetical protein [Flavobacterium amniphilum]